MTTKEEFTVYESVRRSGATNMWDWETVQRLAKRRGTILSKEAHDEIIKNYRTLAQEYDPKRYAELVAR